MSGGLTREEVGWLAGVMESGATIAMRRRKTGLSIGLNLRRGRRRVNMQEVRGEIIVRVAHLLGTNFTRRSSTGHECFGSREEWTIRLSVADTVTLLHLILPWLSPTRAVKWQEQLDLYLNDPCWTPSESAHNANQRRWA